MSNTQIFARLRRANTVIHRKINYWPCVLIIFGSWILWCLLCFADWFYVYREPNNMALHIGGVVKVDFADIRPTWWSSTGGPRVCLTKINLIFERFRPRGFQRGVEHPNRVSFREVGAVFWSHQNRKIPLLLDISYLYSALFSRMCETIGEFLFWLIRKN